MTEMVGLKDVGREEGDLVGELVPGDLEGGMLGEVLGCRDGFTAGFRTARVS